MMEPHPIHHIPMHQQALMEISPLWDPPLPTHLIINPTCPGHLEDLDIHLTANNSNLDIQMHIPHRGRTLRKGRTLLRILPTLKQANQTLMETKDPQWDHQLHILLMIKGGQGKVSSQGRGC